jgi:hypothetical protein
LQGNPGSGEMNVFYDVRLVGFDSRSMSNGGGVDLALSFKNRPPSDGGSTRSNEDGEEDDNAEELTFGNLMCLSPGGRFRKVGNRNIPRICASKYRITTQKRNRTVRYSVVASGCGMGYGPGKLHILNRVLICLNFDIS